MIAASSSVCFSAFARRSSRSMLPSSSHLIATTRMPAITAEAGLVPWAEVGIRHTVRWSSPRLLWYARIESIPAYSPWLPALGGREIFAKPVISSSARESRSSISR